MIDRVCGNCQHMYKQPIGVEGSDCFGTVDRPYWEPLLPSDQDQTAKAYAGKLQLTLVPRQIIRAIARIRMYGTEKYSDPENWKRVSKERYRDAVFRHWLAYLDDPEGTDDESGLPHLWHLACNIAFLCEMEEISNV